MRIRGDDVESSPATFGWYSPTYAHLEPSHQIIMRTQARLPAQIITNIVLGEFNPEDIQIEKREPQVDGVPIQRVRFRDEVIET